MESPIAVLHEPQGSESTSIEIASPQRVAGQQRVLEGQEGRGQRRVGVPLTKEGADRERGAGEGVGGDVLPFLVAVETPRWLSGGEGDVALGMGGDVPTGGAQDHKWAAHGVGEIRRAVQAQALVKKCMSEQFHLINAWNPYKLSSKHYYTISSMIFILQLISNLLILAG